MAKVYRLHNGEPVNGWQKSTRPSPKVISEISTTSKNNKKIATSIPSPFARIDLVKTAFDEVAKTNIHGQTNSHKLVSDALDVGQLFFYFDKIKNQYDHSEIIAWDPKLHINELISHQSTRSLGDTFNLFWNQDAIPYHFDKVNRIFILKLNHTIIGATSPSTIFFGAPDVREGNINFRIGNITLFDENYESLIDRDDQYIKFLYALRKQRDFARYFIEVNHYLDECLIELMNSRPELWGEVQSLKSDSLENLFSPLEISDGNPVEVLGIQLSKGQSSYKLIEKNSGFTISPTKEINNYKPLVLPVEAFHKNWTYTTGPWISETSVPSADPVEPNQRILPGQAEQYPYLTIGDFFEDHIIKLDYELNSAKFNTLGLKRHLIPLKPLIFEYFSIDDIINKSMLAVNENVTGSGVHIKLTIPTNSGEITYSKIYYQGDTIAERELHLGIYPLLKSDIIASPIDYHIGLIDPPSQNDLKLSFWCEGDNKEIESIIRERLVKKQSESGGSIQYLIKKCFDLIIVNDDLDVKGMIVPIFKKTLFGTRKCFASIDFGTTNTHIEYRYDSSNAEGFSVDNLYGSLVNDTSHFRGFQESYERILQSEIYPKMIGKNGIVSFPIRTSLIENQDTVQNNATKSFLDSNVAYFYERIGSRQHHNIQTDFKWGDMNDQKLKNRVKQFIEQLAEGLKFKLFLDKISPKDLYITWLYPVSMTYNQRNKFAELWSTIVNNVFGEIGGIRMMPESIAPFVYYNKRRGLNGLTASIDIGGGSSDISIFENDNPKIISSFHFAGNAVLGDGYNNSIENNGFVKTFTPLFEKACKDSKKPEFLNILNQIITGINPSSSNFSSFLFSVPIEVFNYNEELSNNGKLKFLYLMFYAAQAYYLAKFMNGIKVGYPRNIIFSGTGSKSIRIIDNSDSYELIGDIFEFIFSRVFGLSKSQKIEIILSENPKEITCKGGVADWDIYDKVPVGFWLGGTSQEFDKIIINNNPQTQLKFSSISKELKEDIINSVINFYHLFDEYIDTNDLNNLYGIDHDSVTKIFRSEREDLLDEFLRKGLEQKKNESGEIDFALTESLFFYSLVGKMNSLGVKLAVK